MTDRDRLITIVSQTIGFGHRTDKIVDDLLANGVIVQEWISVEDRLPDVRENPVLVSYSGGVWMAWRHKGWWELPSALRTNYVTHWMPLPKPPKEAERALRKEDEGK